MLTTGATGKTRVNNIYDMAGNLWENIMEICDNSFGGMNILLRGGDCLKTMTNSSHVLNDKGAIIDEKTHATNGFRVALYIKI